jgi:hypothetical protein
MRGSEGTISTRNIVTTAVLASYARVTRGMYIIAAPKAANPLENPASPAATTATLNASM